MSNTFSRRDFMKATAAAVLAVSVSGALTGCGGGAAADVPKATYTLGEFEVTVAGNTGRSSSEDVGENNLSYIYAPKVWIKYSGSGAIAVAYRDVFAAKIGDTELKIKNGGSYVKSADIPFGNSASYQPEFVVSESDDAAFKKGTAFKFYVTLQSQTAEFTLNKDRTVTVKPVEKKS